MHRIDTAGHSGNKFVDSDPAAGTPGTVVDDEWLNAVQEELANFIERNGVVLDKAKRDQLLAAQHRIVDSQTEVLYQRVVIDGVPMLEEV